MMTILLLVLASTTILGPWCQEWECGSDCAPTEYKEDGSEITACVTNWESCKCIDEKPRLYWGEGVWTDRDEIPTCEELQQLGLSIGCGATISEGQRNVEILPKKETYLVIARCLDSEVPLWWEYASPELARTSKALLEKDCSDVRIFRAEEIEE